MAWQLAAQLGLQAISSVGGAYYEMRDTKNRNRLRHSIAAAKRVIRDSENKLGAAIGQAARQTRNAKNAESMKSASSRADAFTRTALRLSTSANEGSLAQRLGSATTAGALAAAAAAKGVGGGSSAMLAATLDLQSELAQEAAARQHEQQQYELKGRRTDDMQQALSSIDAGIMLDDVSNVPVFAEGLEAESSAWQAVLKGVTDMFVGDGQAAKNRSIASDLFSMATAKPQAAAQPPKYNFNFFS